MPKVIINGTTDPVRQPVETSYDPVRGVTRIDSWESAGDNLRLLAAAYQAMRIAYTLKPNGVKSTLVATASGPEAGSNEVTTDTWQILANEVQKDLRTLPKCLAIDPTVIALINKGILAGQAASEITPALTGDALTLYNRLSQGEDHYSTSEYVLRHTTNVSNTYNVNVSDLNVNMIYATNQLIDEATDRGAWAFPMPGRLVYKLLAIPAPDPVDGHLWGWRKLASSEVTAAGNRIEISTEYWLGMKDLFVYTALR